MIKRTFLESDAIKGTPKTTLHAAAIIDAALIDALRIDFGGQLILPGERRVRKRPQDLECEHRQTSCDDCALFRRCRHCQRNRLCGDERPSGLGPWGRHNIAGRVLCDNGVAIDPSMMKGVIVDPIARTVRVQGGATLDTD